MKVLVLIACIAAVISQFPQPTRSAEIPPPLAPRAKGWLVNSYDKFEVAIPPKDVKEDLTELKAIVAKRTADDVFRFHWWAAGGPVYRWNEIIIDELPDNFVTLPLAARHLALFHAALDDAVAVGSPPRKAAGWPRPPPTPTPCTTTSPAPTHAPR